MDKNVRSTASNLVLVCHRYEKYFKSLKYYNSSQASNGVGFVFQVYYESLFPNFPLTKRKFVPGSSCILSCYLTTRLQDLKDLVDSEYLTLSL